MESSPKKIKLDCELCDKKHFIPEDGFAINRRIQNALNIKLNSLKLNPVYEECKIEIDDAKIELQRIEALEKDLENLIYEFEELKRQVDLWREALKLKLSLKKLALRIYLVLLKKLKRYFKFDCSLIFIFHHFYFLKDV